MLAERDKRIEDLTKELDRLLKTASTLKYKTSMSGA